MVVKTGEFRGEVWSASGKVYHTYLSGKDVSTRMKQWLREQVLPREGGGWGMREIETGLSKCETNSRKKTAVEVSREYWYLCCLFKQKVVRGL